MNLKRLSNKALIGYIRELEGLMELALDDKVENAYNELESKKDNAMKEFQRRTESLGEFQRLKL